MIQIENLKKSFKGREVLKGISLEVPEGTTQVILGGSGSGKTVLMKHVIGLFKPDEGRVVVDNVDISALSGRELTEARAKFGMVFQASALFDSMDVFDNVAFPVRERERGIAADQLRQRVIEKLAVVGLKEEILPRMPSDLSGGMRKRVALARALITDPKVVLYDEPTTGLDPITTDYVDEMIKAAKEKLGVTSMVISHDIASAFNVGDSIAVLNEGRIVAHGRPEEVRESKDEFVQKFLSTWFSKQ